MGNNTKVVAGGKATEDEKAAVEAVDVNFESVETPKEEEKPTEEANEQKDVIKKEKIKAPKRKYAIIHGYGRRVC